MAFTLIELLTVVAIIVVLAGLLAAAVGHAVGAAASARCKSNLRQLSTELHERVTEAGFYPNFGLIVRRKDGLATCPRDKRPPKVRSGGGLEVAGSYGYNMYGGGRNLHSQTGTNTSVSTTENLGLLHRREAEIKNPSGLISVTGSYSEVNGGIQRTPGVAGVNRSTPRGFNVSQLTAAGEEDARARHKNFLNALFCDGHVESFEVGAVFLEKSGTMIMRRIARKVEAMRSRIRNISYALLAIVLAIAGIWIFRASKTEAEHVEARTARAVERLRLIRTGQVQSSPLAALELLVRRSRDPEGDATREFFAGMDRLVELGVVQERVFGLADSNAVATAMKKLSSLLSQKALWDARAESNSVVVRAKPSDMDRIAAGILASPVARQTENAQW